MTWRGVAGRGRAGQLTIGDTMTIVYSISYVKPPREVYSYEFIPETRRDVLRVVGRQACNPDLSLDWRDALALENRIRNLCREEQYYGHRIPPCPHER